MPRLVAVCVLVWFAVPARADDAEFFETKIRPVLVEHCYKCHSKDSVKLKGGLRVDGRQLLLAGGDNGPSLVPGEPAKSKLIEAVGYKNPDLQMPPKGKLSDATIRDLETWVKTGAPWPGDMANTNTKAAFDLAKRKADHWSWAPVKSQTPPTVKDKSWPTDPIDRFILARLEAKQLRPAAPADKLVWLRRVTFALTGLPPTPDEIKAFEQSAIRNPQSAFEEVVDRLLALPHFGERWGRHWLDLVRYAESRGHEFDPDIPNAYQYRDYVVRALNADVPYNRFVMEHLAGDVLPDPRIDAKTDTNESIIATGFWHLGEEVHSPVDIRQDQADRLDNRIDVVTKAFLGLTVSCARCHDHKFDAISTKDYYALYGLLQGSSYRQVRIDGWKQNRDVAKELAGARTLVSREAHPSASGIIVDYSHVKPGEWLPDDVAFGDRPRESGGRVAAVFDRFWANLKESPGTQRDHGTLGAKPRSGFTIRTPNFTLERGKLFYLVRGAGTAYAAVDGHTVIAGPLHGSILKGIPDAKEYRWVEHNLAGYKGQRLHVELTADPKTDFAVAMVAQADEPPDLLLAGLEYAQTAVDEKALAAKVKWESRIAPALFDGTAVDEAVFVRGNPRTPGEVVPHRFLEALAGTERLKHDRGSGRLELARQLTDPKVNPFVARVAVNRVWHYLFGRGLVASTDNFGVLGEAPTHPELLDYLADEFVLEGWSTKRLIRRLVLSSSFRMASRSEKAAADPANELLHHFRLKRLEGEAIRDAILAASGRLDKTLGGPSVPIHLTQFLDGRGRPGSGPLDGNGRRSLYLAVRRNFLSPFLVTFDTPIPFSTVGRRQVSNVPAQALILLNDPFVHQQAEVWAKAILSKPATTDERVTRMYLTAFGRSPTAEELATCREFVRADDAKAWADLAHALFNVKEFVFVQ